MYGSKKEMLSRHKELIENYCDLCKLEQENKKNSNNNLDEELRSFGKIIFSYVLKYCSYYEINAVLEKAEDYELLLGKTYLSDYPNNLSLPFMPRTYKDFNSDEINKKRNEIVNLSSSNGNNKNDIENRVKQAWNEMIEVELVLAEKMDRIKVANIRNDYMEEYKKRIGGNE